MNESLIHTRGLGKAYPKSHRSSDRLRALGRLLVRGSDEERAWVLRDVDLDIRRGESLGLIGENGAGKSTLLKLLTGVLTPSSGKVVVNGSVGALLELGAGFHPEYSGRDNIAMAAALHGLGGIELRDRLPQIIEFADIGDYIDEPVKHYSSGMVVRLGFAVIASLKPEVLVTDEVLAVGDESFQKKCVAWMQDYLEQGGTLILVSHSMYHIQKLCRHACWIKGGKVVQQGDVFDVTQAYLAYHERKSAPDQRVGELARGDLEFSVDSVDLNGFDIQRPLMLQMGDALRVNASIRSRHGRVPTVAVGVVRADGTPVYGVATDMDGHILTAGADGVFTCRLDFPNLTLLPGSYMIRVHPMDPEGVRVFDSVERALTIRGQSREFGIVRLEHRWMAAVEETAS